MPFVFVRRAMRIKRQGYLHSLMRIYTVNFLFAVSLWDAFFASRIFCFAGLFHKIKKRNIK